MEEVMRRAREERETGEGKGGAWGETVTCGLTTVKPWHVFVVKPWHVFDVPRRIKHNSNSNKNKNLIMITLSQL
jgi:hypothetical protein